MLGKLIKHEFKNSYLDITIINLIIIIVSIASAIIMNIDSVYLLILPLLSLFFLYFAAIGLLISNIVKSFHQKLFTKEGYLTLTLPVSIDSIIISKLIVNLVWYLITSIVLVGSFIVIMLIVSRFDVSIIEVLDQIQIATIIISIISSISSVVLFLVTLFVTLTLLNIGKIRKHRLILGVLIYYAINTIVSWIQSFALIIPFGLFYNEDGFYFGRISSLEEYFFGSNLISGFREMLLLSINQLFINAVVIVLLYFLGRTMITKKLELE